jgi:hypothetical protein
LEKIAKDQAEQIKKDNPQFKMTPQGTPDSSSFKLKRTLEHVKFIQDIWKSQDRTGKYFGVGQSTISKDLGKWAEKYALPRTGGKVTYEKDHPPYTEQNYLTFKNMAHLIDAQIKGYKTTPPAYYGLSLGARLMADDIYKGHTGKTDEGHDFYTGNQLAEVASAVRRAYQDKVGKTSIEDAIAKIKADQKINTKEAREVLEKAIIQNNEEKYLGKKFRSRVSNYFGAGKHPSDFFATCAMKYGTEA